MGTCREIQLQQEQQERQHNSNELLHSICIKEFKSVHEDCTRNFTTLAAQIVKKSDKITKYAKKCYVYMIIDKQQVRQRNNSSSNSPYVQTMVLNLPTTSSFV